eukprot:3161573-Rhodomonas_salina.1
MSWFGREKGNKKEQESLLPEDDSMPGGYDNRSNQSRMIDSIAGKDKTGVVAWVIRGAEAEGHNVPEVLRPNDRAQAVAVGFGAKIFKGGVVDVISPFPHAAKIITAANHLKDRKDGRPTGDAMRGNYRAIRENYTGAQFYCNECAQTKAAYMMHSKKMYKNEENLPITGCNINM